MIIGRFVIISHNHSTQLIPLTHYKYLIVLECKINYLHRLWCYQNVLESLAKIKINLKRKKMFAVGQKTLLRMIIRGK